MPTPQPADASFETHVRASFALQKVMATLGARIGFVEPGKAELVLPFRGDLVQQHGYLHAGIVTTILDSACGYAAYSLMPPDANVLTVEFKVNLLAPAAGELLRAVGSVVRPGRTLTVCQAEGYMRNGNQEKLVALMQATIMQLPK